MIRFVSKPHDKKKVRAWPFPYSAALSISSDIEFTNLSYLEALSKWLNTTSSTAFGFGLGLEVTNSLFFYCSARHTISVFDGDEPKARLSEAAPRIEDYVRSGWIDTNHGFGDFDHPHIFARAHALNAYDWLDRIAARLPVFTCHGGEANTQGIGVYSFRTGDDRVADNYHADLLPKNGVRYFSSEDTCYEPPSSSGSRIRVTLQELKKYVAGRPNAWSVLPIRSPVLFRDGTKLQAFWRYRGTGANASAPNAGSLHHQLDNIDFGEISARGDAIIIYQHLGVRDRWQGICYPMSVEAALQDPLRFLQPFRDLKQAADLNNIWISGLSRLLHYLEMSGSIAVSSTLSEGQERIELTLPDDYPAGPTTCEGLTVYVHSDFPKTLLLNGHPLPYKVNGPDETGQRSVTVPLQALPNIW
jgi:hypothetical protein